MSKISRRKLLQTSLGVGSALLAGEVIGMADTTKPNEQKEGKNSNKLKVAIVQFRSTGDIADNVRRHCDYIRNCAKDGARVVVFPEGSVTGFANEDITKRSAADIAQAEATICAAAKEANAYAIVGSPTKTDTVTYNSAVVITPEGKIIERYHKVHLAGEPWAVPGDHLSVFPIDGTLCSIIICHDERYPELVRLPVIAGARIVFYISYESGITTEEKIEPYRAQIVARAEENSIYIAHSNAAGNPKDVSRGSHGQSRFIDPGGKILAEASIFGEEVITATFEVKKTTGYYGLQSLTCPFLKDWWEQGAAKVRVIKD